jgi:hypothetical protein
VTLINIWIPAINIFLVKLQLKIRYSPTIKKLPLQDMNNANIKIQDILKTGFQNNVISKSELDAMLPTEKGPGKFYQLFKVHKEHTKPNCLQDVPSIVAVGQSLKTLACLLTIIPNI